MPQKKKNEIVSTSDEKKFDPIYTIGVASSRLEISVHSLRQYEYEGFIIPHKTKTGRRLYSDTDLEKIKFIKKMVKDEGLNFECLRRLMALVQCWEMKGCSPDKAAKCKNKKTFFEDRKGPCWSSDEKCPHSYSSCRDCPVYRNIIDLSDIKKYICNCVAGKG